MHISIQLVFQANLVLNKCPLEPRTEANQSPQNLPKTTLLEALET